MHLRTMTAAGAAAAMLLTGTGCQLFSGLAESYYRASKEEIPTEWDGLKGKTVGVLVAMDPALHTQFPQMELYVLTKVTERLAKVDPEKGHDTGILQDLTL